MAHDSGKHQPTHSTETVSLFADKCKKLVLTDMTILNRRLISVSIAERTDAAY